MGIDGDKTDTDDAKSGGDQNNNRTLPFLKFGRWVAVSIRNPNNFPHYLIAIFTLGLAIFAFFAWVESRRGTQALEGQLRAMRDEQRPYLWITNDPIGMQLVVPNGEKQGTVLLTVRFTNYGRGVAFKFDRRLFIKTKNGPYIKSQQDIDTPMIGKGTGIAPPGKVDWFTATSAPDVSQLDYDWMMRTDLSLGIAIDLEYFDSYGTKFSDTICEERLASGAMAYRHPEDCKH